MLIAVFASTTRHFSLLIMFTPFKLLCFAHLVVDLVAKVRGRELLKYGHAICGCQNICSYMF